MAGIIISNSNYTYDGGISYNQPHGKGTFTYNNGDRYVGQCKYGKADGFGTYYFKDYGTYIGFFSFGKIDGVGTYSDNTNVYKGTWRRDKKHGAFYKTHKPTNETFKQLWLNGKLVSSDQTQYIQPDALQTVKINPITKPKKYQVGYRAQEKKCIACLDNRAFATNVACGHIAMCYECLVKCDKCPICRTNINQIIKLYVS